MCLTPRSNASLMIRRGRRQADLFYGDLYAVYVQQGVLNAADQQTIEQNLAAAHAANAHVEILTGDDPIGMHSPIRPSPRHHTNLRRPQPAGRRMAEPLESESGGAADYGIRRH